MTCIVAKPGQMAADSRDTGTTKRSCVKLFRRHGYLVGGAGASAPLNTLEHVIEWPLKPSVESLTKWVWENHDAAYLDFDQIELVIATGKRVFVLDDRAFYEAGAGAVGSGAGYALGYLEAKPNDLEGAVKAACKYDPYCAGPVREMRLP
jgi:ATP-dependent protease HslVU (ClpYQ) peptidase subunit